MELKDPLDLGSYLLAPTQRLGRYILLLKSLLKEVEKQEEDTTNLKKGLEILEKEMKKGNDLIALDAIRVLKGVSSNEWNVILVINIFRVCFKVQFKGARTFDPKEYV